MKSFCESGLLRYNEFRVGENPTCWALENKEEERNWLTTTMLNYCSEIYSHIDFAISALYEYHVSAKTILGAKLHYLGIPIDTSSIKICPAGKNKKLNLFVGIKSERMAIKGTNRLLNSANRLAAKFPDLCYVSEVRDLPYAQYIKKLSNADLVLDQIYSYTPATNALQAMAMGKIAISGAEPEYYELIGEDESKPVINVLPDDEDIYLKLKQLVLDRRMVTRLASRGPGFVKKHNDSEKLALQFENIISSE